MWERQEETARASERERESQGEPGRHNEREREREIEIENEAAAQVARGAPMSKRILTSICSGNMMNLDRTK